MGTAQLIEKRKEPRHILGASPRVYVRINFPYPKENEIEKEIIDISKNGLSFKMNMKEGYFPPGTPLPDIQILQPEYNDRPRYALVRHVTRMKDKNNIGFNRIGIEFINRPDNSKTMPEADIIGYKLRERRYPAETIYMEDKIISFLSKEGKRINGSIINFSKFGIAFSIPRQDNELINISDTLKDFNIIIENKSIYRGKVTVVYIEETKTELKIGGALRDAWIHLDTITNLNEKVRLNNAVRNIISTDDEWKKIDPEYKSLAADLRLLLEETNDVLAESETRVKQQERTETAEKNNYYADVYNDLKERLDKIILALSAFAGSFDHQSEEHAMYRAYLQKHIEKYFLLSPLVNRIYTKPMGYPGDYLIVDMIYKNKPQGENILGSFIDQYTLEIDPTKAHRNRAFYLRNKFINMIESKPQNKETRILSIGSGPAEEIQQFIKQDTAKANRCQITLLDFDLDALHFSHDKINEAKIIADSDVKVNYVCKSIIQLLKNSIHPLMKGQDIIYCMGLYDYFADNICRKLTTLLHGLLAKDGMLVISNLHSLNRYKNYMEYVGEWYLHHRSHEQMIELAGKCRNLDKVHAECDETQANIFLVIEK